MTENVQPVFGAAGSGRLAVAAIAVTVQPGKPNFELKLASSAAMFGSFWY
jgi:hypothetical protein